MPINYNTTIVLEGITYGLLDVEKFDNSSMEELSLVLASVTDYSMASDVKNSCIFEDDYMEITYSPKVYYNRNGSGTYEDASDAEKLNKANYTECN